nr:secreted seminal-vesicle Ly-6 protein 1-like [Loxodonta africana]
MDKRLLLLMLGLSLMWGFLQGGGRYLLHSSKSEHRKSHCTDFGFPALQCYKCPLILHDGSCEFKRTTCHAGFGQKCILFKHFEGDKFLFGLQDCWYLRRNLSVHEGAFYTSVSSCKKKNFCNKF